MKAYDFLDAIGGIDPEIIEEAGYTFKKNKPEANDMPSKVKRVSVDIKKIILVASLFLFFAGIFLKLQGPVDVGLQSWSPSFSPDQYFLYSDMGEKKAALTIEKLDQEEHPSNSVKLDLSHQRQILEEKEVIPPLIDHPNFAAEVFYGDEGQLQYFVISWQAGSSHKSETYRRLTVRAGYDEKFMPKDGLFLRPGRKGRDVGPGVTITDREGKWIVAKGSPNTEKTMAFINDSGWYEISGSAHDDYEAVVELYEWYWDHPIDFNDFSQ